MISILYLFKSLKKRFSQVLICARSRSLTGYCMLSFLYPCWAEEQTLPPPVPPSCANNVVNLSHLPSSIKTPVRKDVLIWDSVTHQCLCVCVCWAGRYREIESADHLRGNISVLCHSSTEKGASQEASTCFQHWHTHTDAWALLWVRVPGLWRIT